MKTKSNIPGPVPFEFKVCPDCKVNKPRSEYYKKLDTVSYRCKPCTNAETKARKHLYDTPEHKAANLKITNAWRRDKVATDPDWVARRRKIKQKRYDKVKASENARRRELYQDPDRRARILAHNKRLKHCTPKWADPVLLRVMYVHCPKGFAVDHIIPLKGELVSGLHVPANLQYLTTEENSKKYNAYPV